MKLVVSRGKVWAQTKRLPIHLYLLKSASTASLRPRCLSTTTAQMPRLPLTSAPLAGRSLTDADGKTNPENQRALLPEVRPQAELLLIQRRADLLHAVHGEVHVGMEPGQLDLHQPVTAGAVA